MSKVILTLVYPSSLSGVKDSMQVVYLEDNPRKAHGHMRQGREASGYEDSVGNLSLVLLGNSGKQ